MKMVVFYKLSTFLLLSLFLLSSGDLLAKADDDFLECLSHQMNMDSSSTSQFIYTPNNLTYSTIFNSYVGNPRLKPVLVANKPSFISTPTDESQIQAIVHCSRIHDLLIRVRSGGHDYEGLSYISETPFIVIDLRNLRSISVDATTKTAWVQTGATLGELYYSIATKSGTLAYAAGVCPTVGVGGHFSGGGYGMLSRKFGLASDNIVDATIIDANGRALDRKSMEEDLFWAIRGGGGSSFGIIVSWKLKLLDIPEKVTVFNVTRSLEQNATELIHKWQQIAHKVDNNLLMRLFIITHGKSTSLQVSFTTLYVGGIKQLLSLMQENFPELGLLKEDCSEMSWIQSVLYFAEFPEGSSPDVLLKRNMPPPVGRAPLYFKAKSDYVQQVISIDGLNGIWKKLHEPEESVTLQLEISPYGGKLNDYSESETPFPHRAGNLFMIHYAVLSTRKQYFSGEVYRYLSRFVSKSPRRAYINYRDLDLGVNNGINTSYARASIWGKRYFNNNFRRLVQVKTKVDPTNFFRDEQSVPPLSKEKHSLLQPKIPFSNNYF